jgi:hypothetical protein
MSYQIVIKEEAYADTLEAYRYYEEQLAGLGERFLAALLQRYSNLSEHPDFYSYIKAPEQLLRDVVLHGFPYVVVFEISGKDVIVYAVHNTHKRPKKTF